MRKIWILSIASLLFLAANDVSHAQYKRGVFSLGIQGGAQHYDGDYDRADISGAFAGVARFMVHPFLGIQVISGYSELKDDVHFKRFFTDQISTKVNVNFLFYPTARVAPYVYAGGEAFSYRAYQANQETILRRADGSEYSGITGAASVGAGVEAFLTPNWSFQFSGDYNYAFTDALDGVEARHDEDGWYNARVTLLYNFFGDSDVDLDGIFDKEDLDPKQKEDFDGYRDWDGMPDPDNDEDGILDAVDKAPNEAEDKDGFEDFDGVPDYDNDRDGVPDSLDLAPDTPEDIDGFEDRDGKPDPDNDQDGIPDVSDGAPNQAEDFDGYMDGDGIPDWDNDNDTIPDSTDGAPLRPENFNGYQDDDGIPDKDPWLIPGAKMILEGVTFQSGSATLNSTSYQMLNTIAERLRQDPQAHLDIQGYTDDRGAAQTNLQLSLKRANSVRSFLISKGIAPNRLMATGFGESNPIAPNDTAEGRRANRRIEIVRIK